MLFQADLIIWDYEKRAIHARLQLHKAKVEGLAFSPNDKYLVSLGGQDDGSIVVWNLESKEAICGSPASAHSAGHYLTIEYTNHSDNIFISAGNGTMRVWEVDLPNRKIRPTECQTGQLKRIVNCIEGVNTLKVMKSGDILVGSGDGMFTLCSGPNFKTIKKVELEGGVTFIAVRGEGHQFFAGTEAAQIYRLGYTDFREELIATSHNSQVNDVAFPFGTSELFATCSQDDIRVWHAETSKELLRFSVPNMSCNALDFMIDGHSIISAWNDGKIRVFAPETGRAMLVIPNAHSMGVTAITGTRDCKRIISGGGEGQVRVWEILQGCPWLIETMKEHKVTITSIKIKSNDKECVTASSGGACIIWDLVHFVRNQMVLANTLFSSVCYHPEEYEIITSGTDRKIGYWEVYDGSAIRELEGSLSGAINGMHISQDGQHLVTGGDEKLVKVWDYSEGELTHVAFGHSGSITSVKISTNNRSMVSASVDGAVLRWRYPHPSSP
uniref:cilia- and flagella-associated protein 52-like n=1 Tax=Oncorhynchus gorbuscha TaxID=8017 RepID=UPI001EAEC523|nr:cilia- and flagella-associated protein 52-like [Oncorhynchus gorbuscha]